MASTISVIIPAHNEAAVIGRCLDALTRDASEGELEVVVVCNGCEDDTASVARSFGGDVHVIETPVGSKPGALNLGDRAASIFPRFYIDADVVLSVQDLRRLAQRLEHGSVLAVAPLPKFDLTGCSWPVRAYYDIHTRLPAYKEGIGGSGVYGLSMEGRRRFLEFPMVTADDGLIRLQFRSDERETVETARSVVWPPKTLRELMAIKTRSHLGNVELKAAFPDLWPNFGQDNTAWLGRLFLKPWLWPALGAYVYVKTVARIRVRHAMRTGRTIPWGRDQTSRGKSFQPQGRADCDRLRGPGGPSQPV